MLTILADLRFALGAFARAPIRRAAGHQCVARSSREDQRKTATVMERSCYGALREPDRL